MEEKTVKNQDCQLKHCNIIDALLLLLALCWMISQKQRLKLIWTEIVKHHQILSNNKIAISVPKALEIMNKQQQLAWQADQKLVDTIVWMDF